MEIEKQHYLWQRRTIAIVIFLLAPLSVLFGFIGADTNPAGWWHSISDTYYANSVFIMMWCISISSFFFITYKGYDIRDRIVNIITGIGLIFVLIFPCENEGVIEMGKTIPYFSKVGLFHLPISISKIFHYTGALTTFGAMFINVTFLFTLGKDEITEQKKIRNIIYRICGIVIAIGIGAMIAGVLFIPIDNFVWIAEFVILTACSLAWLIKGESLKFLNDK
jgi:hypothetical protein